MSAKLHFKIAYHILMRLLQDCLHRLRLYLIKIASKSSFVKANFNRCKKYFKKLHRLGSKKPLFTFAVFAVILHIFAIIFYISFYKLRNQHYKFGSLAIISTERSGFNLVGHSPVKKNQNSNNDKNNKNQKPQKQSNQSTANNNNATANNTQTTDSTSSTIPDDAFVSYSIGSSNNPAPHYPKTARERGLYGKVEIITYINPANGKVFKAEVLKSSGHRSLDGSALSAISKWTFDINHGINPSALKQKNELVIVVPVNFTLI